MRDNKHKHGYVVPKSMLGIRKQDHLPKPLKEAYEKMMLFSNGKLGKLSMGQVGNLENLLLEALIWPLAE